MTEIDDHIKGHLAAIAKASARIEEIDQEVLRKIRFAHELSLDMNQAIALLKFLRRQKRLEMSDENAQKIAELK
jgi:GTP1/Obg family GTP-binding protein